MDNKPDQNTSSKAENEQSREQYPTATFAGGCFWGTEYVFGQVPGVKSTAVGFMGGRVDNPTPEANHEWARINTNMRSRNWQTVIAHPLKIRVHLWFSRLPSESREFAEASHIS